MARSRYSKKGSRRGKSRRSHSPATMVSPSVSRFFSTCSTRMRRGGYTPGAPEIVWPLKPNQLLPGLAPYQRGGRNCDTGGVLQPTGSRMLIGSGNGQMMTFGPTCGRM